MASLLENKVSNFSTNGNMIGFILEPNNREDLNNVKAYVPKLMSGIEMGNKIYELPISISTGIVKNKNVQLSISSPTKRNYITLSSNILSGSDTSILNKGQRIDVNFTNGDLTKGIFNAFKDPSENVSNQYVNTRFRTYVENVKEIETPVLTEEDKDDYFASNKFKTGNTGGGGSSSSSSSSSSSTKKKTKYNSRTKSANGSSLYNNVSSSSAGSTSDSKPEVDCYDLLMDTTNEILGLRMGTSDTTGKELGKEKIPSLIFDKRKSLSYFTNGTCKLTLNKKNIKMECFDDETIELTNNTSTVKMQNNKITLDNKESKIEAEGTTIKIDNGSCIITLLGSNVTIEAGKVKIQADVDVDGDITCTGDVKASGKSLVEHTHTCHDGDTSSPN